jgi:hypothetical protein
MLESATVANTYVKSIVSKIAEHFPNDISYYTTEMRREIMLRKSINIYNSTMAAVLLLLVYQIPQQQIRGQSASPTENGQREVWAMTPSARDQLSLLHPSANDLSVKQWKQKNTIDSIAIQQWGPPDTLNLKPGYNRLVTFRSDGKATYKGISGVQRIGTYQGEIDAIEFGKLCVLLECFLGHDLAGDAIGREVAISQPVVSQLVIGTSDKAEQLKFRNDRNFGDFRFWVVECALIRYIDEIEWKEIDQ